MEIWICLFYQMFELSDTYFFLVVSIWFFAESPVPPPVVSWLVVSLVLLKPGVLAPPAPVPVESPEVVEGLPLHEANANTVAINMPIISFSIVVVSFSIFQLLLNYKLKGALFYKFTKSLNQQSL